VPTDSNLKIERCEEVEGLIFHDLLSFGNIL
jgi:hypothetical protein